MAPYRRLFIAKQCKFSGKHLLNLPDKRKRWPVTTLRTERFKNKEAAGLNATNQRRKYLYQREMHYKGQVKDRVRKGKITGRIRANSEYAIVSTFGRRAPEKRRMVKIQRYDVHAAACQKPRMSPVAAGNIQSETRFKSVLVE
jgi:hypothetical protein